MWEGSSKSHFHGNLNFLDVGLHFEVILEAKVTLKGTCGLLWGSSEGKWGSLLAGCWLAGSKAGWAGRPRIVRTHPGGGKWWFWGLTHNQSTRLQATKLQDYRTTSYQTARLEVYKDYIDT